MSGPRHAQVIRAGVQKRKNILLVGATGSGKTILLSAILDTIAELTSVDSVISIEDTTELPRRARSYLDLRAVGEFAMVVCMRASMRLTRDEVGEVRGAD